MFADPQRVVLGVDPERVEADRLEHVLAAHPQIAAVRVDASVAVDMTDVQSLGGRVRELDQVVEDVVGGDRVEIDATDPVSLPAGTPPRLDRSDVVRPRHRADLPIECPDVRAA